MAAGVLSTASNAAGIDGLHDRLHTGRPSRLTEGQMARFRAVVLRGPDIEKDGVSSWTAEDLCRIVEERHQLGYSENGMSKLLKSLDLSRQKTRPVRPRSDREAQLDFETTSRDLITEAATARPEAAERHSGRIEVWLRDEARIGRNCLARRGLMAPSAAPIG